MLVPSPMRIPPSSPVVDRVSMRKKLGLFSHTRYVQAVRLPPPDSRSKRLVKDRDLESRIAVIIRLYAALAAGSSANTAPSEPAASTGAPKMSQAAVPRRRIAEPAHLRASRVRSIAFLDHVDSGRDFKQQAASSRCRGAATSSSVPHFPAPRLPAPSIAQRRQLRRECT